MQKMWKNSFTLNILITLIITRSTKAGYYEHNQSQYKQDVVSFKCTEEGYHPDPRNCRVYYRCVDWGNGNPLTNFRFECGVGTVFSKGKGDICTHPEDSDRFECVGYENELDSNLDDSSENLFPIRTTMQSQISVTTKRHVITSNVPVTITPTMPIITTENSELKPRPQSTTNRPTTEQSKNDTSCQNKSKCTQEGFLSDSCDCRKFYRCVNDGPESFRKYDFMCGIGTIWDPDIQGCNHEWAVTRQDCRQGINNDSNIDNIGQWNSNINCQHNQSAQIEGQSENTDNQTEQPGQSNQSGTSGVPGTSNYPAISDTSDVSNHPGIPGTSNTITSEGYPGISDRPDTVNSSGSTGISSYPETSDGPGISTSPGIFDISGYPEASDTPDFSENSSIPNYPVVSSNPSIMSPPSYPEISNTSGITPSTSLSGIAGSSGSPEQSDTCTQEGFFPDSTNCHKFYRCVYDNTSFTKYEFQCGIGTAWDTSIQNCNHEYLVPRCNHNTENIVTDQSDISQNELDSSNTSNTNNEIVQSPPIQSIQSSTASTMDTTTGKLNASTGTTSIYLPPASSTFSITTIPITEPASYSPLITDITSKADTSVISTSTSVSYLPPVTTTANIMNTILSTVISSQGGKSKCIGEGFYPNPNDCRKFYRCVKNLSGYQKYEFQCGPGTAWDQSIQTCNYMEQVISCLINKNEIGQENEPSVSSPPFGSPVTNNNTSAISSQDTAITLPSVVPSSTEIAMVTTTPHEIFTESTTLETDKIETPLTTPLASSISNSDKTASAKPEEIQMSISSSTESTSSSESTPQQSSFESNEESSSESHILDCTTRKPNNTILCNHEGFHPHPTQCNKFYRCVDNGNGFNVYHFNCPSGTIFDPSINVCNYPESVYPARDCITGNGIPTSSDASIEHTIQSETMEESTSIGSTTEQNISQQTESTISSEEITTSSIELETTASTVDIVTPEESTTDSDAQATTSIIPEATESTITSISESFNTTTEMNTESINIEHVNEITTEDTSISSTESETESETSTIESQEQSMTVSQEGITTESQEQSTTEQSGIETQEQSTTELSDVTTTASTMTVSNVGIPCPIDDLTADQITLVCPTGFRRHPKHCNLFYQCTSENNMEIKILILTCPEDTIFDEQKIQCLPASRSSQACMNTKANNRFYRRLEGNALAPIKVSSNELCPEEGHFPHTQGCSNVFYKCKRDVRNALQGYLYRCPQHFIYWSVSRRCERMTRLPMCSHSAYKNNIDWNDRWQIPIEDFNLSARMLRFS